MPGRWRSPASRSRRRVTTRNVTDRSDSLTAVTATETTSGSDHPRARSSGWLQFKCSAVYSAALHRG
eukprot:1946993-Rhodomonas_salina.1